MKIFILNLLSTLLISQFVNGQKSRSFTKKIEDRMIAVGDQIYTDKYEASNLDYNTFLLTVKDSFLYTQYAIDSIRWTEFDYKRNRASNTPMKEYYHRHEGFEQYPAVNVPYEGALAYCRWLTDRYNNEPKRKFKKIVFTLPTENEWIIAAKGGNESAVLPWNALSFRDTRKSPWQGGFLANFSRGAAGIHIISDSVGKPKFEKIPDGYETPALGLNDRAFYTAEVRSFFPNAFGLYNISGNVAEMTIVKGLTKGGSWHSLGREITIPYKLYFYKPSPEVGFRVFMKVIEE